MTEYERKWLSFVEETKATDTGILNEYISDIINTAKTIADRAKGQGSDSPLSGLGRGNVKTKKEVPATAGATAEPEPVPVAAAPKPEYVYDYFGDHLQKVKNREEYKRLEKVHKKNMMEEPISKKTYMLLCKLSDHLKVNIYIQR